MSTDGVEVTALLPEIRALHTRLELQGAWIQTETNEGGFDVGGASRFRDFQLTPSQLRIPCWDAPVRGGRTVLGTCRVIHQQPQVGLAVTAAISSTTVGPALGRGRHRHAGLRGVHHAERGDGPGTGGAAGGPAVRELAPPAHRIAGGGPAPARPWRRGRTAVTPEWLTGPATYPSLPWVADRLVCPDECRSNWFRLGTFQRVARKTLPGADISAASWNRPAVRPAGTFGATSRNGTRAKGR